LCINSFGKYGIRFFGPFPATACPVNKGYGADDGDGSEKIKINNK